MGLNILGGLDWLTGADQKMKVSAPPPRDLGGEIRSILGASKDLYQSGQEWNPKFTEQALQNQNLSLYGTPNTDGLINQYRNALPQMVSSQRAANPAMQRLMDELNSQAMMGLQAGNQLSPQDRYNTINPVRQDWANRGLGYANPAMLDEAVQFSRAGDAMRQQRQAFGSQAASMENSFYTQPGTAATGNILGMGQTVGQGQNPWDKLNAYGSDVFNTNYNADAAARIATSNNQTGAMSSMMSY